MNRRKGRKGIALLLALCMVMTLLPAMTPPALAAVDVAYVSSSVTSSGALNDKSQPFNTIENAYGALTSAGGEIVLLSDINSGRSVFNGKTVTLRSDEGEQYFVKRNTAARLLDVTAGTVTLENIILDGMGGNDDLRQKNSADNTALGVLKTVMEEEFLVAVGGSATFNLGKGAIIQNSVNGGILLVGNTDGKLNVLPGSVIRYNGCDIKYNTSGYNSKYYAYSATGATGASGSFVERDGPITSANAIGIAQAGTSSAFNMTGGEICYNKGGWGTITVWNGTISETMAGRYVISGGNVHHNEATDDNSAGAILVEIDSSVTINGGTFKDNKGLRGGIVWWENGLIQMGSSTTNPIVVKGNTNTSGDPANVVLASATSGTRTISLTSTPKAGSEIGVRSSAGSFTDPVQIARASNDTIAEASAGVFISDITTTAGIRQGRKDVSEEDTKGIYLAADAATVTLSGSDMKWYSDAGCTKPITFVSGIKNRTRDVYAKANDGYRMPVLAEVTTDDIMTSYTRDTTDVTKATVTVKFPSGGSGKVELDAVPAPLQLTGATFDAGTGALTINGTWGGVVTTDNKVALEYRVGATGNWVQDTVAVNSGTKDFTINAIARGVAAGTVIDVRVNTGGTNYETATYTVKSDDVEPAVSHNATVDYVTGSDSTMGTMGVSATIVTAGQPVTFTASPNGDYAFAGWYATQNGDNDLINTSPTYTTVMPDSYYILYAKFTQGYQPTQIVNGGFELPVVASPWSPKSTIPGWSTTDSAFEVVHAPSGGTLPPHGITTTYGDQYVEMNYSANGILYQDLRTTPQDIIVWSLKHGARTEQGEQTMKVIVGKPTGTTPTTGNPEINSSGSQTWDNQTVTTGWTSHSGVYTVPAGQTETRFAFQSISPTNGCGNLLDDIQFKTLLGNVELKIDPQNSNQANVTYYWDDTSAATLKYSIVEKNTTGTPVTGDVNVTAGAGAKDRTGTIDLSSLPPGKTYTVSVYHSGYTTNTIDIDVEKPLPTFTVDASGTATLNDKNATVKCGTRDVTVAADGTFSIATGYTPAELAEGFKVTSSGTPGTEVTVKVRKVVVALAVNGATGAGVTLANSGFATSSLTAAGTTTKYYTWASTQTAPGTAGTLTISKGADDVITGFNTVHNDGTKDTTYHSASTSPMNLGGTGGLTGTDAGVYTINVAIKSKAAMLTDGLISKLTGGDGSTQITDSNLGDIADGLVALIGAKDDGKTPITEAEANRNAFKEAFRLVDNDLTNYDLLTPEGKKEVAMQLVKKLTTDDTDTVGELADALVADFGTKPVTLEKFAGTQYKLENSNPTNGSVKTIEANASGGLDIALNLGSSTDGTEVTPKTGGVVVYAVKGDGSKTKLTGSYTNGVFTATGGLTDGNLPPGTTALEVQITDGNDYKTVTKTVLTANTISGDYKSDNTAPEAAYGGMGGDIGVFSKTGSDAYPATAEKTVSAVADRYTKYSPAAVTYASGGTAAVPGNKNPATTITLTATPDAGAYVDGFVVTNPGGTGIDEGRVTAENVDHSLMLGTGAKLTGPDATGKYTLEYNPEEAGDVTILTSYRNLLGEINVATDEAAINSVLGDGKFKLVFDGNVVPAAGQPDGAGSTALAAYTMGTNEDNDQKVEIRKMLLQDISRGTSPDVTYDVAEFNAALLAASNYVIARDAAIAKANEAGSTVGSVAEVQKVLADVDAAYAAYKATGGITSAQLEALTEKIEKAQAQLVPATFSVEIKPILPEGVSITVTAAEPEVGSPAAAQSVTLTNGQTGHVFPKYGTDVTLTLPTNADYDVYVGDSDTPISGTTVTIDDVTDDDDLKVEYRRKDVTFTLPTGVTASTANPGSVVKPGEGADAGKTVVTKSAGTDVTLTFAPDAGKSILPGATVMLGIVDYPVTPDGTGGYEVTVPINELKNMTAAQITDALNTAVTDDGNKLAALIDKANDVIAGETSYDITNNNNNKYTPDSWAELKEALDAAKTADAGSDDAAKAAAATALEDAYKALVPQYAFTVPPTGLTVPEDADGKPTQEGVVKGSGSTYYVADGVSLELAVALAPTSGKKVDSVSYTMNNRTSTAYPVGGIVTIPVVKGALTITPTTSDLGFAVDDGPLGAAIGDTVDPNIYTVEPFEGNDLTSVTVDGTKVGIPDPAELQAVLAAGQASGSSWTLTNKTDPARGATFTVAGVNGRDVVFTMAPLDAAGNATGATTVTATLPGLGKVEVSESGGTVTAKVLTKGATGLNAGTEIVLTGTASNVASEIIKIADADGNKTGAEIKVLPATGTGGVTVDFGRANTGSHSVAATTTLKSFGVDMSNANVTGAADGAKVTANKQTVKYGEPLTITIPAPKDTAKEVGMDTTISGTVNGVTVTGMTLAALQTSSDAALKDIIEVTINANGSATLTIHQAKGATSISAVDIGPVDKDTAATATQLAKDKSAVAALALTLGDLLAEAGIVEANDGKLYNETTDEWKHLFGDSTATPAIPDLAAAMGTLQTALANAAHPSTGATDSAALLTALNSALGVSGADAHTSVAAAIAAIKDAADALEKGIADAQQYADGVVTVTDAVGYGDVGVVGEGITIKPVAGMINPNAVTGGADLEISGITMKDGYLPRVTVETDKGDKTFVVQDDGSGGYAAHEVTTNADGSETIATTSTSGVTVTKGTDSKFTVTFANANLNENLGFGDPDKVLGNITGIDVYGQKQGVILPSAAALKAGLQTGSTNGAGADDVSVAVGSTTLGNNDTPVVPAKDTATITVPLSEDDYHGPAGTSTWNKTLTGVELEGKFYELDGKELIHTDAAGNTEKLAGVTVEETTDTSGNPVAKVTINTDAAGFKENKDYTTLQLVLEPTNSQYKTFKTEFGELTETIDTADAGKDKDEALGKETLAAAIKRVEKLMAEAAGALPEPYALTQQNKDYLTGEIAQLSAYKDRLTAFYNAARVEGDIDTLYKQIKDELEIPIMDDPIPPEKKATLAALEEVIKQRQSDYNNLTPFEKTLVSPDALKNLNDLADALRDAQRDGMSDVEKFDALVGDIAGAVGTNGAGINGANADLIDSMIRAAEDMYAGMSPADKTASAANNKKLNDLKAALDTYLEGAAKAFAEDWLTTAYTAGADINKPGTATFDGDATTGNRLDSDKVKQGYADRLLLAKQQYDALSAAEQAAVDKLFQKPTLTELYEQTFPELRGAAIVPDEAVAANFLEKYLSVNGKVIDKADATNYNKILGAWDAWDVLTAEQKDLVNTELAKLGTTYEKLYQDALMVHALAEKDLTKLTDAEIDALGLSADQTQALKDARDFINNHLKYDGSVIIESNGNTRNTIRAAKGPWDALSALAKAAVNGALTGNYKGQTYEDLYSTASQTSGDKGGGGRGTTVVSGGTSVPVVIDGVTHNIGERVVQGNEITVTVNQTELNARIADASESLLVPISTSGVVGPGPVTASAQFVVKNLEDMEAKEMTLIVQSGGVNYEIPASAIDTAAIMAELGATDSTTVPISVSITFQSDTPVNIEGATVVVEPFEFTVTATYNGRSCTVSGFEQYTARVIEVTAEQARRITTAVVYEDDGSVRHVPTNVYQVGDKWYARINSLTNSTYVLIENEQSFADAQGKWFEDIVNEMASRKIIAGRSADVFDGEANITRAEFAAIIVRALGLPASGVSNFTDVDRNAWYYGVVSKALEYGIVQGTGDGSFAPDRFISRQDAMLMVQRAAKVAEYVAVTNAYGTFTDLDTVSAYAQDALFWNLENGFIVGSDGLTRPQDNISRGECATIVLRLLQKSELVDVRTRA